MRFTMVVIAALAFVARGYATDLCYPDIALNHPTDDISSKPNPLTIVSKDIIRGRKISSTQ